MRLTRRLYVHDRVKLDLVAESFNLLNRDNQRVQFSDDGFLNTAGQFVQVDNQTGINHFPAQYPAATELPASHRRLCSASSADRFETDFLNTSYAVSRCEAHFSCLTWLYFLTCMLNLAITIPSKWDEFGGVSPLAEVRLQEGESLENALRRFKRKVQQEDIIKEGKRHSFYLKPGEKKRVKEALARKRSRKKARKEQD